MNYIKELDKLELRDSDRKLVERIKSLKQLTDWDNYVLLCILCGYAPTEELLDKRYKMKDTPKVMHFATDYKSNIKCTNLKNTNKFGLYEYSINTTDKTLINMLWQWKSRDCLKYVSSESDHIVISISRHQFNGFVSALDALAIDYDIHELRDFIFYDDSSGIEKADSSFLPFKLFDYQQEDVDKIIKRKRMLIGHEMGCIDGRALVNCRLNDNLATITLRELHQLFSENRTIQIRSLVNGRFEYIPIRNVVNSGKKQCVTIKTSTNEQLTCTYDHKVLTERGWIEAKDLDTNDSVIINGNSYLTRSVDSIDNNGYVRIFAESQDYPRNCECGALYHEYVYWRHAGKMLDSNKEIIHHKDYNRLNNDISNLACVSIGDYTQLNSDVITSSPPDEKLDKNNIVHVPRASKIVTIEDAGIIETYDVSLDSEDIHNFIANNIVVHNCGKTIMSIVVGENIEGRKLVVCPESLRLNWKHEIERCGCKCEILLSNENYHISDSWTIVGFQTAFKFYKQLKKDFNCIFVDEVHKCKAVDAWGNPASQRAKAVFRIANSCEYCYLLTGTPIPSSNRDLFNILKILKCNEIDKFNDYIYRYCGAVQGRFGLECTGNTNAKELNGIIDQLMIRRLKKDVLPNLRKQRQFIPIEPKFRRDYKDIENRLYYPQDGDNYMGLAMTGRRILSEYKVNTAISLAEDMLDSEQQVVLVTNFIDTADSLKDYFGDIACEITGGQSYEDRDMAQQEFQQGKKKVCILNMQVGGVGLTLTAACNMIILDYSWIPADCIQTEDRICRPGQSECCNIYYIYCMNSIFDKLFCKMMTEKSDNISKVVDGSENTFNLEQELEEYVKSNKK